MKKSKTLQSFARIFRANINLPKVLCRTAAVVALGFVFPNQAGAQVNKLVNPGFEQTPLGTGWTTVGDQSYNNHPVVSSGATYYNAGECTSDPSPEPVSIHGGTNVANVFGPYFSNPSTAAWTQQGIPAAAGSTWNASGWAYASHEDLSGPNQFHFEADFYNASGTLLAAYQSYVVENLTCGETTPFPLDTWVFLPATNVMQITGGVNTGVVSTTLSSAGTITAPPGAVSAAFQAVLVNINYAGGSMYLDDCSLNFLSGPVPPTVSPIAPNGIILCTNTTLTTTATAASGATISSFQVITTTSLLGATTSTTATNTYTANSSIVSGLGTATASLNFPLTSNLIYNVVTVVATDSGGFSGSARAGFDTLSPSLVIEAEDFNYSGGQYLDTPANGGLALYATAPLSVSETDYQKNPSGGNQAADGSYYRSNDVIINGYAAPANGTEQKYVTAAANGNNVAPVEVGYNSPNDWLDYTRTYGAGGSAAAGTYYVYARLATVGSGLALNFYQITSNPTQPNQSSNLLGSFSFTDNGWNTFDYVPLVDQFGNLVSITLSGAETFRSSVVGNPNIDFYMLTPAVPILTPKLVYAYPDGLHPFEPTNSLTFSVGPANGASIASSGIDLVLNGVDVTASSKFKLTQAGGVWTGSYPVVSNAIYTAVINATNTAGLSSTFDINFDTFNPNNYQWEAVDYDYTANGVSGLFIDYPVPSCDTSASQTGELATNSYFGYPAGLVGQSVATQGIDIYFPDTQPSTSDYYRADGVGSQPAADYVRPKFLAAQAEFSDANIGPINIGYYNQYNWLNYTRTYPTNNYYIWGRLAGGAGAFSGTALSILTSGYGTSTQTTNVLGTFADPNASGWQAWHWVPMLGSNGAMAVVSLGGQATLKVTSGNNLNTEFFMLVPAPLQFSVTAAVVAGQLNLSFPTETGHTYTLYYTASLSPANWSAVAGSAVSGDGNVHTVTRPLSGTQGYYAISAQ